jgi:integrase
MSLFKRGQLWWYKFKFAGQTVRESSKSASKAVARDAEHARRRELEIGFNQIPRRKQAPLFSVSAREWISEKSGLANKTCLGYEQRLKPVVRAFGQRLVCDLAVADVIEYRSARLSAGASNRTVNYEVGCIRGVLKRHGLWAPIAERIKRLRENHDVGRALSPEHEARLLAACRNSKAPSLLPLFILARDTGLRAAEIKALRHSDLSLVWKQGVICSGEVIVPRSKTEAGTGRGVPLSPDVCSTLTLWLSRFPNAKPESYVFPRHAVRMLKGGKETTICSVDLRRPVQSWQHAWRTALKEASNAGREIAVLNEIAALKAERRRLRRARASNKAQQLKKQRDLATLQAKIAEAEARDEIKYRWHDLRHTFVTRLAENPNVSEQTIRALAGHVSKQMLERYSHIRTQAKQDAIAALYSARSNFPAEGAQKWAQSAEAQKRQ